jgi:hypothetical protein
LELLEKIGPLGLCRKDLLSVHDVNGEVSHAPIHALRVDPYLHQHGIDTTTPGGKAMFQMCGAFAEFERAMIDEVAEDLDILWARYNRQDDLVLAAETLISEVEQDPEFCKRNGVATGIKRVRSVVTAIEENAKRKLRHEIP